MGKNQERYLISIKPSKLIAPPFSSTQKTPDVDFTNRTNKLKELFCKYNAKDG